MRLTSKVEKQAPAYPLPSPPRIDNGSSIQTAGTTAKAARAAQRRGRRSGEGGAAAQPRPVFGNPTASNIASPASRDIAMSQDTTRIQLDGIGPSGAARLLMDRHHRQQISLRMRGVEGDVAKRLRELVWLNRLQRRAAGDRAYTWRLRPEPLHQPTHTLARPRCV